MNEDLALIMIAGVAALDDLYRGKISNGIIVTGLCWGAAYQFIDRGLVGVICFLGGVLCPLLLTAGLFYFRMIGAGDLKLLAVIGGFLGPVQVLSCMAAAVFIGGAAALVIMLRRQNMMQRFTYLFTYLCLYSRDKKWSSYLSEAGKDAAFCFSVPVFWAVLWYVMK